MGAKAVLFLSIPKWHLSLQGNQGIQGKLGNQGNHGSQGCFVFKHVQHGISPSKGAKGTKGTREPTWYLSLQGSQVNPVSQGNMVAKGTKDFLLLSKSSMACRHAHV